MAACGSLQHIFDTLLPEKPTLLESLSWNQIKPINCIEQTPSYTEIFGELHFKESPLPSPSSSNVSTSSPIEINHTKFNQNGDSESPADTNQTPSSGTFSSTPINKDHANRHKNSDSFSSLNSESLQLCTEGLGFESSDEVEDMKSGMSECWQTQIEREGVKKQYLPLEDHKHFPSYGECRIRSRVSGGEYPPPISCIGRSGKPWICFKSYRSNGRFVLKEIRIPTQEFLHAYREDGRLKLQFVQPDHDEFLEEEEEEENDYDDDYDDGEDDVESVDEGDGNMGKENDDCVTDHVNEEKEIDAAQVTKSLDLRQES